jgi:hypothetical protein
MCSRSTRSDDRARSEEALAVSVAEGLRRIVPVIHGVSNPKLQIPSSNAFPSPNCHPVQALDFGGREPVGIWSLELGI